MRTSFEISNRRIVSHDSWQSSNSINRLNQDIMSAKIESFRDLAQGPHEVIIPSHNNASSDSATEKIMIGDYPGMSNTILV